MFYTIYSVFDVTSTGFQKLMFFKQNTILLIYKFTSLLLVSKINAVWYTKQV